MGPKGPIFGPEGPHRCSRRLQPSAGARKKPPIGRQLKLTAAEDNWSIIIRVTNLLHLNNNLLQQKIIEALLFLWTICQSLNKFHSMICYVKGTGDKQWYVHCKFIRITNNFLLLLGWRSLFLCYYLSNSVTYYNIGFFI